MLIKHSGSNPALPWSVQLDSDVVVVPIVVYIDLIQDVGEIVHLLGCRKRLSFLITFIQCIL